MGNRSERDAPPDRPASGPGARGSRAAGFAALAFDQFRAGLHRYLLRRLRHSDTAEDLAQEVYLRLLRFTDRELVQCPEAYVYRVACNVLCEFKLHEQRSRVNYDSDAVAQLAEALPDPAAPPEALYEQRSRERQLETVLAQLPPMQRAVFLLAKRHDLSHEDIARELNLSLHTVRKYLYRTLHYCRQQMAGN